MEWFRGKRVLERGGKHHGQVEEQAGLMVRGWCHAEAASDEQLTFKVRSPARWAGQEGLWAVARSQRLDVVEALGIEHPETGFWGPLPVSLWEFLPPGQAVELDVCLNGVPLQGQVVRLSEDVLWEEHVELTGDASADLTNTTFLLRLLAWLQHAQAALSHGRHEVAPWLVSAERHARETLGFAQYSGEYAANESVWLAKRGDSVGGALALLVWGAELSAYKAREARGLPLAYPVIAWLSSDGFRDVVLMPLSEHADLPHESLSTSDLKEILRSFALAELIVKDAQTFNGFVPDVWGQLCALLTQHGPDDWLTLAHGSLWIEARKQLRLRAKAVGRKLVGRLELVTRDYLHGWAMDLRHPNAPVSLEVRFGDMVIAQGLADGYREDVLKRYGLAAETGFRLRWDSTRLPAGQKLILSVHEVSSELQIGPAFSFHNSLVEQRTISQVLSHDLEEIRQRVNELAAMVPEALEHSAFSIDQYHYYRMSRRIPPPRTKQATGRDADKRSTSDDDRRRRIVCWLEVTACDVVRVRRSLDALRSQDRPLDQILIVGDGPGISELGELLSNADQRVGYRATWTDLLSHQSPMEATDWVVLIEEGDLLDEQAIAWIDHLAENYTHAPDRPLAGIFWDEDRLIEGPPHPIFPRESYFERPILRARFDADAMLEFNVVGSSFAVRGDVLSVACEGVLAVRAHEAPADGCEPSHARQHEHERKLERLPLAISQRELLVWAVAQSGAWAHIPHALLTQLAFHQQADMRALQLVARCEPHQLQALLPPEMRRHIWRRVSDPMNRTGKPLVEWAEPKEKSPQGLSVLIATRDRVDLLARCISSLVNLAVQPDRLEVLVADNGSTDPETLAYLAKSEANGVLRVLRMDEPFNWSRLNNQLVRAARHERLLFLNNDTLMLSHGWDAALVGVLERSDVGAVGARLLYDDLTIQHAGVILGYHGFVGHEAVNRPVDDPRAIFDTQLTREVSGVTGAFLATRREVFERAGPFDEAQLAVAFNDVDWCMRLRALGLRILYVPRLTLIHYESKSRGLDHATKERRARAAYERIALLERWPSSFALDEHRSIRSSAWSVNDERLQ